MLEGQDKTTKAKHPGARGEVEDLPLSTPANEARSGLDKVPVALLTNAC